MAALREVALEAGVEASVLDEALDDHAMAKPHGRASHAAGDSPLILMRSAGKVRGIARRWGNGCRVGIRSRNTGRERR